VALAGPYASYEFVPCNRTRNRRWLRDLAVQVGPTSHRLSMSEGRLVD